MSTGQRYSPYPPPTGQIIGDIVRWLASELRRVSVSFENIDADTVTFGREVAQTVAGAATINWAEGPMQRLTYSGTATVSFVAPVGVCELVLVLVRGGSATLTLPSTVKWAGGVTPTWSTTVGRADVVRLYFDGTNYHGTASIHSS